MEQTFNYDLKHFKVGQIIEGEVIKVTENEVTVNFGDFTEGTMYLNELTLKEVESAKDFVKVGDKIIAKIKKRDDEVVLLSRLEIERDENHRKLLNKFEHKNAITGKVEKEVKGGLIVKIYGIDCFMPTSEIDVDIHFDATSLLNQNIKVKIIEVAKGLKNRDNVIVSRKVVIAAELFKEKLNKYKAIELDAIYEGEVVRVESYGVLVVANGYQGLVPYREISHLPFSNITEVLNVGDKVNVKVTGKNDEKSQVLFSIKTLLPKPWEVASQNIKEGDVIEGKVVRLTDFGAFINVYPLVDGLLHKNEYTFNPFLNMFDEVKEGQTITVKVISIDSNRERLSLSVKQLKEDPWLTCGLKPYEVVDMTVVGFDNGDAVVQYVADVVGILPKNQVSSERKITKAEDELTTGQTISVKVTNFDASDRYLQVSIRKIKDDAERQDYVKYMKEQDSVKNNNTIGDLLGDKLKDFLK
ncbi:MAG: ribosomal protein [Haloplasmataceae bacterium]|nr:ribosomal protein [Haloplasmataceae bacterium]